jgi:hypothetical protein
LFDAFPTGNTNYATKTIDPAPPNLEIFCHNFSGQDTQLSWMLAGRTG